jgi:hypothetical protein
MVNRKLLQFSQQNAGNRWFRFVKEGETKTFELENLKKYNFNDFQCFQYFGTDDQSDLGNHVCASKPEK